MEMTLRWYGTGFDTVTLKEIRQIPGVTGVITTLYDTKPGEVWSRQRIRAMKQEVEAAALAESLNRFLESLPQEKRVLFVRRYWYLCSVEELAAWSGRRRGTVSAALFRLRQDLQEHLEREGFTL